MTRPSANDLELPIRGKPMSGPAVDRLEARKEENDGERMTAEKLAKNFAEVGNAFVDSFKRVFKR